MAYTVHDTPDVVARIEDDLSDIVETVHDADPGLRALVLTGAFARGEGAVRDGQPQNDYDLVALRRPGPTPGNYPSLRAHLEWRLGLHIDLAPVSTWRLRFVQPSIFWYETAQRGQILSGPPDLLERIPVRDPRDIQPQEGLRLLTNRAAGLLFATRTDDPDERRLQACKGLLAALDARLLSMGLFAPTQTDRWHIWDERSGQNGARNVEESEDAWFRWAYQHKVDPAAAPMRDGDEAWLAAAHAIRYAIPIALRHAGYPSLDAYTASDGLIDRAYFLPNLVRHPDWWRMAWNPTGNVRVTTLRMLLSCLGRIESNGSIDDAAGHVRDPLPCADLADLAGDPTGIEQLERLRNATLQ